MKWTLKRSVDPLVVMAMFLGSVAAPRLVRADGDKSDAGSLPQKCASAHDGACVELDMKQEARRRGRASPAPAEVAKKPGSARQPTSSSQSGQGAASHGPAATSAVARCEGKIVNGQCILEFENDELDGSSSGPRLARVDASIKPKTDLCTLEREEAYRLIREGKDSSQAEEKLTDCYERVTHVSIQLDREVSLGAQCPTDFQDVDTLRELQTGYDAAPKEVSLSELIAFPLNPDSSRVEPHLPYACGYNQSSKAWFSKRGFHCTDVRHCYNQSYREAPLNRSGFEPIQGETNLWKATGSELGTRSYRAGGVVGDLRIVRLSEWLYLQTYRKDSSVYYFGLIFVPNQRLYLKKACELETSHEASGQEIAKLIVRGDVLDEIKEITARLAQNAGMPEPERQALREKAEALMAVLEGKEKAMITDDRASESACARLDALDGRAVQRKKNRDKLMDEILGTTGSRQR